MADTISAQIEDLKRLASSTSDATRKSKLEKQIRALEVQQEAFCREGIGESTVRLSDTIDRAPSFNHRPSTASSRPRTATLMKIVENQEISSHLLEHGRNSIQDPANDHLNHLIYSISSPSYDPAHSPMNISSCDKSLFWMSTGLFPQIVTVEMRGTIFISSIEITASYVTKLQVRLSHPRQIIDPKPVGMEFDTTDSPSVEKLDFKGEAVQSIHIEILKSSRSFCVVHGIRINGEQEA